MANRMKLAIVLALGALSACAATYSPPTTPPHDASRAIRGSADVLMRATKQTLVVEDFQITATYDAARVISTAPRDTRLTPAEADCGTTMGIDYLKDNRTASTVAYGAVITDGKVLVKATIAAKYLPNNNSQSITMDCVSKGVLEAALLSKIQAAI